MRLLSVLLGVGLVLGLTVFVMDRVNQEEHTAVKNVGVRVLPGGIVIPPPDSPAVVAPTGAIDAAQTVACASTAQALRGAEDNFQALNGHYADYPTLVSGGIIRAAANPLYRIESVDGYETYKLVGQNGCP